MRGPPENLIYIDYFCTVNPKRESSKVYAELHTSTTVQIVGGYPGGAKNSRKVMLACKSCSPTNDVLVGSLLHVPTEPYAESLAKPAFLQIGTRE
jgi:hypothetical protein